LKVSLTAKELVLLTTTDKAPAKARFPDTARRSLAGTPPLRETSITVVPPKVTLLFTVSVPTEAPGASAAVPATS